ncbi:DUF605-domain-containing protein [Myriangium duriaei CBS 260.36]|uniref:DUF605-domain-containing protein n=1 Tax=Myriangium duriaei CBS 260.36 TaxID=1168546 RepID=A0A9P4J380_9PEZI|nr:DUF605-domain-containing protein [Myriangium duriaei CBS 260.36]
MAATLPAKLKVPGIQPFAVRAAQLEKFKPIISYWCNYHVVNQILSKGLHAADDECRDYTTNLMDKLETVKGQTPPVDAIVDDIAAKAYVEQFALETFQKADNAIHTDKASRQTIDTFQAASTFLELLSIWGQLEPETSAKIKYAKFHALRIAKALKAGEDPNASNPKDDIPAPTDPLTSEGGAPLDGLASPSAPSAYRPPTVEDDTEVASSSLGAPSGNAASGVSPMPSSGITPNPQNNTGGEYFPPVPTFTSETTAASTTTADADIILPDAAPPGGGPGSTAPPNDPTNGLPSPQDFYTQRPAQPPPTLPVASPPVQPQIYAPKPQVPAPPPQQSAFVPASAAAYRTDDESVALAQKHAKWAISALNFEDVPTAVKELRVALQHLGAS